MTPVQTTRSSSGAPRRREARSTERPTLLTRSETVECNCPDHCERDHERLDLQRRTAALDVGRDRSRPYGIDDW